MVPNLKLKTKTNFGLGSLFSTFWIILTIGTSPLRP